MLLRGAIPLIEANEKRVEWDAEQGQYALILESATGKERIAFDGSGTDVLRIQRWSGTTLRYDVRFASYEGEKNGRIPKRIRLKVPEGAIEVDMTVKNHQLNPDLPLETFQIKPPRGVAVQSF